LDSRSDNRVGSGHVWFPVAAPGGVLIQIGQNTAENRAKLGKSALAGPIVNMVLAVVFAVSTFALIYFVDSYTTGTGKSVAQLASWVNTIFGICVVGVQINAWLAFFNLIPLALSMVIKFSSGTKRYGLLFLLSQLHSTF